MKLTTRLNLVSSLKIHELIQPQVTVSLHCDMVIKCEKNRGNMKMTVRFEVPSVLGIRTVFFWYVKPCSFTDK